MFDWKVFDGPLCRVIDQLGCTRRLEVDIRIIAEGVTRTSEDNGVTVKTVVDSLAGFREKGHIRVVWVSQDKSESVVYPPAPTLVE